MRGGTFYDVLKIYLFTTEGKCHILFKYSDLTCLGLIKQKFVIYEITAVFTWKNYDKNAFLESLQFANFISSIEKWK